MRFTRQIVKPVAKTAGWFSLVVLLLCGSIYVPPFQKLIVNVVLRAVNSNPGMEVCVEGFRLKFPLTVEARGVEVYQNADTMLLARTADLKVRLLPLIAGDVDVSAIGFNDVFLKIGHPDSAMWLRGNVGTLTVAPTEIDLGSKRVELGDVALRGGDIEMIINPDTTPPTPPSAVDWHIVGRNISLSQIGVKLRMLPAFESIEGTIGEITVASPDIDLGAKRVNIDAVGIDSLSASLLTPREPLPAVATPPNPYPSAPMAIEIGKVTLSAQSLLYAKEGTAPTAGLDFGYLSFADTSLEIDSVYNCGPQLSATVANLYTVNTTSGIAFDIKAKAAMDSLQARLAEFSLSTGQSSVSATAVAGLSGASPEEMPLELSLSGKLATADLQRLFPQMADIVAQLPQNRKINIEADAYGNMARLNVRRIEADIPRHLLFRISGALEGLTLPQGPEGTLTITGDIADSHMAKSLASNGRKNPGFEIPPLKLGGNVRLDGTNVSATLNAVTGGGELALDAKWISTRQGYDIALSTRDFPVDAFLPGSGVGHTSLTVKANGERFDFTSLRTRLDLAAAVSEVDYNGRQINDVSLSANLSDGKATVAVRSRNPYAELSLDAAGNLDGNRYRWTLAGDIAHLYLDRLGLSDTILNASARFNAQFDMEPRTNDVAAKLNVAMLDFATGADRFATKGLDVSFSSTDTLTSASVTNGDLSLTFSSPEGYEAIIASADGAIAELDKEMRQHSLQPDSLQKVLPKMKLAFHAGTNNILASYLADNSVTFNSVSLNVDNTDRFAVDAVVKKLKSGELDIDDLTLSVDQSENAIKYSAAINNLPGTMDNFAHVNLSGQIDGDKISAEILQKNIKGETGFNIGAQLSVNDSLITVHLVPEHPVIDYKKWNVNPDNFISLNTVERHIDADINMQGGGSSLRIFTDHAESAGEGQQEDLNIIIDNLKLQEWLSLSPFAPPVEGSLSVDMKLGVVPDALEANGTVSLDEVRYNRSRVGSFGLDVDLTSRRDGSLAGNASLGVDGKKVAFFNASLNDTAASQPMRLDMTLQRLPLSLANPFLGASTGDLSGYLNGKMDIGGSTDSPKFDGWLQFDSTTVNLKAFGSKLRFSEEKIAMDSNVVRFDNYSVYGLNDNPLQVNGTVDLRDLSNVSLDLDLDADDIQLIGSKQRKGSELFGNGFFTIDATAKGNLKFLRANADVIVMPGTNVTYVLPGGTSAITQRSSTDMVRFVNFADTAAVEKADTIAPAGMLLNVDAILHIAQGSTISVDLSSDGMDKVQLQSNGTLDFSMDYMGDTRLTGRLNINKGFFRYNPPVINQLLFDFVDGSYVTFNGALLNPQLNVHLQEKVKANVTQDGANSRLINFLVGLGVTGSLQNMNVAFDLSTDDDITVSNELQSMSPEQRANQAMNLLLYNTYTGPGTKASSSISGNPLYSFLETQLNTFMARNVKAVDISFGFDQYDKTADGATSTTTSYSYKVSKSFLNDRFKIVVGGNYTTDADPDENLSQNLINDISFEYMLNRSGSMYLKLFRHTGYESILEGEITQTGVGFVYRRKLRTLSELFRWYRPTRLATPGGNISKPTAPNDSIPTKR